MVYRLILPDWAKSEHTDWPKTREGEFTSEKIQYYNKQGYNVYWMPNRPSVYNKGTPVEGADIDVFNYVFVDMDLKDGVWTKETFIQAIKNEGPESTFMVDTGGGIHVYWSVSDLDSLSFLRLSRRLCRRFQTDESVQKIFQLMRLPDTYNTKIKGKFRLCKIIYESAVQYTSEQLDSILSPISEEDEQYCQQHFAKTYRTKTDIKVSDTIPVKFKKLIRCNPEVKKIWAGEVEDRSVADYRLGHIMFAEKFTKEEAMSVLVNTSKALTRAPVHRVGYAEGIVDKIWTFETTKESFGLSRSVQEILNKHGSALLGDRFPCHSWIDDTETGFRLGHVIGLVGGAKVGKTALCLNMFYGFVKANSNYDHMFVALEQPANEIALLWQKICGEEIQLHDRVHILSNYNDDGSYRNLSLEEIQTYVLEFQRQAKRKVGCVVVDHIGALKRVSLDGRVSIEDICHNMKAFAIATNTLLIMQSHSPREKAGIGDIELNKDAAYGTTRFEGYVDYLITTWQPLKRCHMNKKCPTVTAFKFCAIRHKHQLKDVIQEDVCYRIFFEPETSRMRELTQDEETAFSHFNRIASNKRKESRKRDEIGTYTSAKWAKAKDSDSEDSFSAQGVDGLSPKTLGLHSV